MSIVNDIVDGTVEIGRATVEIGRAMASISNPRLAGSIPPQFISADVL